MGEPQSKKAKLTKQYELLYHPGIPGRGEFIRLAFEAAGARFKDVANEDKSKYGGIMSLCSSDNTGDADGNPPIFAPPALRVKDALTDGKDLVISQTPNILLYLGPDLGLAGTELHHLYHVNELTLTALDFNNEVHDTHHPIASSKYYEDQKDAALAKATDFREFRIPKYLTLLQRALSGNESHGQCKYLVGDKISFADTTWWHVLDGLSFAFPKEIAARRKDYPMVFEKFYAGLKEEHWLKNYLESGRRLPFSNGVFRHYPELDRQ